MNRSTEDLFSDWSFLSDVAEELNETARKNGVQIRHESAVKRSQAIDRLLEIRNDKNNPQSWIVLANFLFNDQDLDQAIRNRLRSYGGNLQNVVDSIKSDLYFIVLRNAENWSANPDRGSNWRGLIHVRIRELAIRHQSTTPEKALKSDVPDESIGLAHEAETAEILKRAIQNLDPGHRQLIRLHFFERKRISDISRILDIPYTTASDRLENGVVLLRIEMAKLGYSKLVDED